MKPGIDQLALFSEPKCARCGEPCFTPVCWVCLATLQSMSAWDEEWWIAVPGREGAYMVSTLGRVRSVDRVVVYKNGRRRWHPGRVLKPHSDGNGYQQVHISRTRKVHQFVLEGLVGPCPDGMQCCHWNDVKADNRLVNLRWDTPLANMRDAVRNGGTLLPGVGRGPGRLRSQCAKGHNYTPENTIRKPSGSRACRACRNDYQRRHRAAHRTTTGKASVGRENTPWDE